MIRRFYLKSLKEFSKELDIDKSQTKQLLLRNKIPHRKFSNKTTVVGEMESDGGNMNPTNENDLLTVREAAEFLKVSMPVVYSWCKQRRIPYHRIGKRTIRFSKMELEKMLVQNTIENF